MHAVLLAAGFGTRLRPLSDVLPKCLAPIRGRPLLEYWLRSLFEGGIERVLVNTHHRASLVETFVKDSRWSDRVVVVHETALLGTGGTLLANASFVGHAPIFVAHADNLTDFDLRAFLAAHATRPAGTDLTMMTFTTSSPSSCGVVTTDANGVVNGFFEKVTNPPGNRANAAVYVFEPEVVDFMREIGRPFVDISLDVLPRYIGRIATWHNNSYHRDIGTMDSWLAAQTDFPCVTLQGRREPDPWQRVLDCLSVQERKTITGLLAPRIG